MSTITKDLGAVTAYAYAKEKGYTGTEAEFAELMASYATVAEQASQSAQTATEKAQQASASATSASQSAYTASASAQTAQTAQQTATAKASEAQQSAQTATTKAQEASQSASESSQSASTAVQAKQDAESAKTASETAQGLAESARDDAESARDEAQQYAESIDPQKLIGAYPTDTATGAIASFSDGADNIPMKKVTVRIEPKQAGTGDPSPDNVRPISGWDSVQVSHSGADRTNPITKTIPLPQTVYGGTLDVTNGVLTVDRAMVDLGTLTWSYVSSQNYFYANISGKALGYNNIICSMYKTSGQPGVANLQDKAIVGENSGVSVLVKDSSYADATAFKNAVTGQQLVYELTTPITFALTPTEIKSLLGDNNLWGDTGDTTVTYRADTTMYINRKIAEAVSALS